MLKKYTAASWLTVLAAIAGIVGVIFMLKSSNIDTAYAYKTVGTLTLMGICGVVLCLAAVGPPPFSATMTSSAPSALWAPSPSSWPWSAP